MDGAQSDSDARRAAREISSSNLVKAMVHGRDPNWGRIMMAVGKSGIDLDESKIDILHQRKSTLFTKGRRFRTSRTR